ncbi:hypothetical protein DXG03_008750 [Asterophora parasitica]|uniref:Cytochrome P450 n=1 Tax=Asterophora parasitica TaxID=117018 RepID=A0A9P7KCV7_9AGAR|nr:hypothetical protein DXG03_008750 [Asterophora parasitica]
MATLNVQASVASFVVILYLYLKRRNTSSLPLPPGPKKRWLFGNILDLPKSFEWISYHNWCKEFGANIVD